MQYSKFVFILLFTSSFNLVAQAVLKGHVLDFETNQPLEFVTVIDLKSGSWTVTDKKGSFSLSNYNENFEIEFQILGKEPKKIFPKDLTSITKILIKLKDANLRLDEVHVTAVPKRSKIGSAVVLDEYSINQIQAYSLSDVLNQLPGQTITPPSLNASNTISLRTAQPNKTNAFGVAYILDDMRLSNDENMQTYNNGSLTTYDNANSGIDLRSIPASNIDEIEVISGIPDAKYGNLTSGVIKINRKAGVSPFRANANIRQGNTSVSISKGVRLSERLGNLSLSFDYLNANADPTNSLEQYDRITASGIWSIYNTSKSVKNTLSLTLHNNLDDTNFDLDNDDGGQDAKFKKDRGFQLSNLFSWQPQSKFIDQLNFSTGISYSYQHSYSQSFINDGGRVVPTSLESGLFSGSYTPVAYLQIRQVYGQPINFNVNSSISKNIELKKFRHNLNLGANFSYSDNTGKGRAYDPENAHTQVTLKTGGSSLSSGEGIRPLDFGRYVKPRINIGIYAQDNITYTLPSGRSIYANLGLRYDNQNSFSSISPRINVGTELSEKWSIRGGLGFASKAPSLSQIFPGDKYFDILLRDFRTASYSFNLVQTYKRSIPEQDLEPIKSWKYELGLNYNADWVTISATAFLNQTFDGIASYNVLEHVDYPEVSYSFPEDGTAPTYTVDGYSPFLLDYDLNTNANKVVDKGIELLLNFKKIESINTSFNLVGSYTYSNSTSNLDRLIKNTNVLEKELLYGYYTPSPTKNDQIRLRGTITHHLSEIGLLISLTAEQFTRSRSYNTISSIYPVAYVDPSGARIPIISSQQNSEAYSDLWLNPNTAETITTPAYHNFHLRVTKELLNGISMSLYANNFLNYQPLVTVNDTQSRKNALVSFGGQVQYQF